MKRSILFILLISLCVSMLGCSMITGSKKTEESQKARDKSVTFQFENNVSIKLYVDEESKYELKKNPQNADYYIAKNWSGLVGAGTTIALKTPVATEAETNKYDFNEVFKEEELEDYEILQQGQNNAGDYYYIYLTKDEEGDKIYALVLNITNEPVMILFTSFKEDGLAICKEFANEIKVEYKIAE